MAEIEVEPTSTKAKNGSDSGGMGLFEGLTMKKDATAIVVEGAEEEDIDGGNDSNAKENGAVSIDAATDENTSDKKGLFEGLTMKKEETTVAVVEDAEDEKIDQQNDATTKENDITAKENNTEGDETAKDENALSQEEKDENGGKEKNSIAEHQHPSSHAEQNQNGTSNTLPFEDDLPPMEHSNLPKSKTAPNSEACIRILTKFQSKSQTHLPTPHEGEGRSLFSYIFGGATDDASDPCVEKYWQLCSKLSSAEALEITGEIAKCFLEVVYAWCSVSVSDRGSEPSGLITAYLLSLSIDTAESLVAHGCLDNVYITLPYLDPPTQKAVYVLTDSFVAADLSSEQTELSALKFLLTTGCRVAPPPGREALLRGTHLLQAIRMCYHVYLRTASEPNRTTARAALQQLTTSVFQRMQHRPGLSQIPENGGRTAMYPFLYDYLGIEKNESAFASPDHRDAFLVLRSLCKLSMKNLPDAGVLWDGGSRHGAVVAQEDGASEYQGSVPQYQPALDSKILALELLLYVLENSQPSALLNAGSQFLFAIRHYLCVSLLNNCTSNLTQVVGISLRLFIPLIRHFRSQLKTEIEAFVTNVFFVILDSPNSTLDHKTLVVTLLQQIGSDSDALAEIFLNYDCDMSAVDLFDRIVNALAKVARMEETLPDGFFVVGTTSAIASSRKRAVRRLRMEAMRALRQVLASLHASTVKPVEYTDDAPDEKPNPTTTAFVEMYDTKKKLRSEQTEVVHRFNQKPSAGLAYAAQCGHLDASDPTDVARFLLQMKDKLDKTTIGEYLGREVEYHDGFCLRVLHQYVQLLDFEGMVFDDAIRHYLSGFRLPGEAQKIDRIMEKFAERYCTQNPQVFPTADAAFILAFSVIMLNTDLHNPAIKEERRMTKGGFIRNNRGICDGGDLPEGLLIDIFDRIQMNPISLKEDDEARERAAMGAIMGNNSLNTSSSVLYSAVFPASHFQEMEKGREYAFLKERDHILRTTESLLLKSRRKRSTSRKLSSKTKPATKFVRLDTGLRDQYVKPMFDVTWGPALAVFSTAMENANAKPASLVAIDTEEEMELAEENANATYDISLSAFRLAICTAGLCGNETARGAFVRALYSFTQLGSGRLMNERNIRSLQTLLKLGRDDGELLGNTWEHIFRALSEVARLRHLHETIIRNDRVAAAAAEREDMASSAASTSLESESDDESTSTEEESLQEEEMDRRAIDEANAGAVYEAVSETFLDGLYAKSTSLSSSAAKEFVLQLCRVSRMEISGYGGHVGSRANQVDLSNVHYRQQHTLLSTMTLDSTPHHNQPIIYSLQKLVEVTHYNMDSRPRLIFAEMWATIAGHLTSTSLHSNAAVAMYAVDSFRQLAIQFLQREELGLFEFQRRFLKPLETVMARSEYASTKELLLKCIEQMILMFGTEDLSPASYSIKRSKPIQRKGTLRSGWKPVLAVIGLAGNDPDTSIANMGFKMLNSQVVQCLKLQEQLQVSPPPPHIQLTCPLLNEHFVDLIDALVKYVNGKQEKTSLLAIDHIIALSDWLADESIPLPLLRRRPTSSSSPPTHASLSDEGHHDHHHHNLHQTKEKDTDSFTRSLELELWWPILLGLSRSVGDSRRAIREKSFRTLLDLINTHFFPSQREPTDSESEARTPLFYQTELQTLQLIFRGILTCTLEHAETDLNTISIIPPLPQDFCHFITTPPPPASKRSAEVLEVLVNDADLSSGNSWLDTTFDPLLDACVSICLRSMRIHKRDALVEEILAMLNSCLLSDSGALAVRGLRRLQRFITRDLTLQDITEDTWAVVCHMLRRCLTVRGLSTVAAAMERLSIEDELERNDLGDTSQVVQKGLEEQRSEDLSLVQDFVMEEELFAGRRYVGSTAIMVIGDLLTDPKYSSSMGMRWFLFLVTGLGWAIQDWEQAAALFDFYNRSFGDVVVNHAAEDGAVPIIYPPHYLENAFYGRKWMVRLILLLAQKEDILKNVGMGDMSSAQNLLKEQTQSILSTFLEKEAHLAEKNDIKHTPTENPLSSISDECRVGEVRLLTAIVCDLLEGYNAFDDSSLSSLVWLCPMLGELIESNNRSVRSAVHGLVSRMFEGPFKPMLAVRDEDA